MQRESTTILSRIMIFGIPGSGKSTFAKELGQALDLPVHHLDKYFFIENWQERPHADFLEIQQNLVNKSHWIIDGNATKSFEMRFSRAELVFYFRFNRFLCLYRIIKRLIFKNPDIPDRAPGCTERLRLKLIRYLWGFNNRVEKSIQTLKERYPNTVFKEIKNKNDLRSLIPLLTKKYKNAK